MSYWLDDVARKMARPGLSRRSVLRRLGAGLAAGVVAALGRGARVEAQVIATRRCVVGAAPNTPLGCPTGQTCCPLAGNPAQGICCPAGTVCTGSTVFCRVCPATAPICGTGTAAVCCDPTTNTCIGGVCCPIAQVCATPTGLICCPAGTICVGVICT